MKHELTDTIFLVLVRLGAVERLENILASTAFFPCSAERLSLRRVKSKRPRLQKDKNSNKKYKMRTGFSKQGWSLASNSTERKTLRRAGEK
jgi:hypothetical protein